MTDWSVLGVRVRSAVGPDAAIDAAVAEAFSTPPANYTGSVTDCRALVAKVLPGWRLHLGFDASGTTPCATVSNDDHRAEAMAPTMPLAILRTLMELACSKGE